MELTWIRSRRGAAASLVGVLALLATLLVAVQPAQAEHTIIAVVGDGNESECTEDGADDVMEFTVSLFEGESYNEGNQANIPTSPDPNGSVSLKFSTAVFAGDTATPDADFVTTSGQLVIDFPSTSGTIEVPLVCDSEDEGTTDETFTLVAFELEGARFVSGTEARATGFIENGGAVPAPKFSVSDAQPNPVTEGDPNGDDADPTVTFTITMSDTTNCTPLTCSVAWETQDDSATAGSTGDYEADNGTERWRDGDPEPSKTVTITINSDNVAEPLEHFTLELSSPMGGTIAQGTGTAAIADDDASRVAVRDATSREGDGDHQVPFRIDKPIGSDVWVVWHSTDGSAKDGSDYAGAGTTATKIAAGTDGTDVPLAVTDDETIEPAEEYFYIEVECLLTSNSTDCDGGTQPDADVVSLGDSFGVQTIQDDDPKVNVADASANEGDGLAFTVTLSEARSDSDVTATLKTSDGSATAGQDYEATEVTVTFPAGSTTPADDEDNGVSGGTVTVASTEDTEPEGRETFTLAVTDVVGGGAGTSGTGTIIDDDPGPEIEADAGPDKNAESFAAVSFDGDFSGGTPPVSYAWDFGDGSPTVEGEKVTHRYESEGTFTVVLTVTDDTGKTDTDEAVVTVTDTGEVLRSSGQDRIDTAIDVSRDHWASAKDVVMATAFNFPDGLAGSSLTAQLDAPLLLTAKDELRDDVAAELDRLGATRVILLGGTNTISEAVADDLRDRGYTVERVAGANRFETAGEIAREVGATAKGEVVLTLGVSPDGVQVAWADALSAGSFAALDDVPPTLLTERDALPEETEQALEDVGAEKVYILGGPQAISAAVEAELEGLGYDTERIGGDNRFDTSALVAAKAISMGTVGRSPVFVTGFNFPDGLTAGALAARVTGPVLLVPVDDLNKAPDMREYVEQQAQRFDTGTIVGGPTVVSETVRQQLEAAMEG